MQTRAKTGGNTASVKWPIVCLLLIVAFAFAVRIIGLRFGFPYLFHPDEPTAVKRALLFFRDGLNPHWFGMPSFYLYLLHFSYLAYYKAEVLLGLSPVLPHLQPDRLPFYLIGRIWSALLGTGTVLLVYLTGKRLYSAIAALAAAFLIAVIPLHLIHSHYATVDVPVTFLITLSFFFSASLLRKRRLKYYLLAGGAAGLAAATKYNGIFTIFPFLAAHFLRERGGEKGLGRRIGDPYLFFGLGMAALTFVVATPYSIIELSRFLQDLATQSHYLISSGHGPIFIDTKPGALYQIRYTLYYAGGAVFWVMAIAGLIYGLRRRRNSDWLILSWVIPYFILISIPVVKFSRFFIPMLPFLSLWAGRLLEIKFKLPLPTRLFRTAWILSSVWLLLQAIAFTGVLARTDPRIEAKIWLEENLPRPSRIGLIKTETGLIFLDDPPLDRNSPGLVVEQYNRLLPALNRHPQYIIATDFDYRQILRLKELYDQKRCDRWNKFLVGDLGYQKIKEFNTPPIFLWFSLGGKFPPHDMLYNRPRITIFQAQ